MIFWWTCDFMNIYIIVRTKIVWLLGTTYWMIIGLNERTNIGSLNNTRNVIFWELNMAAIWNILWYPISDILLDLYYYAENVSIYGESIVHLIYTEDGFKYETSEFIDMVFILNKNNYWILIHYYWKQSIICGN